jgi:hypothetical protein
MDKRYRFTVRMTEESRRAHERDLVMCSDEIITLARHLQRMAFFNSSRLKTEFSGYFNPSPLYIAQAKAIMKSDENREMTKRILNFE